MNKKGIELSINFLVILLISLTVFGFGVIFIYKIGAGTDSLKRLTLEDIDSRIDDLRCAGTEKVCLTKDSLELKAGDLEIIGIKVNNIMQQQQFIIKAEAKKYVTSENIEAQFDPNVIGILPGTRTETIEANGQASFGIGFEVKRGAKKGTYVIDVTILNGQQQIYDSITHKVYIRVP